MTIVEADDGTPLSQKWLDEYLDRLFSSDFQPKQSFLTGLIITRGMTTHTVLPSCRQDLESLSNRWLQMEKSQGNPSNLQPGPYLYTKNTLKPVYRLYDDTYRTFLTVPYVLTNHVWFERYRSWTSTILSSIGNGLVVKLGFHQAGIQRNKPTHEHFRISASFHIWCVHLR